jgi:uncharacterized protein YidB (DUF937 family)
MRNLKTFLRFARYCFLDPNEGVNMGLSNSVNGAGCAALASVVSDFIRQQGGVTGVVNLFEKQGLGATIQSWVGKGENHPIFDGQIFRALGYVNLQQLGMQIGLSAAEMAVALSAYLPKAIEKAVAENTRRSSSGPSLCRCFSISSR